MAPLETYLRFNILTLNNRQIAWHRSGLLVVGLPLCLLVNWAFRHVLNQWVHVLAYALVGMLFGLVVLTQGAGGILPMLIPVIGFPAGILMGLGRLAARPLVKVVGGAEEDACFSS